MRASRSTIRLVLVYGILLAFAAFALEWLQYQYFLKAYPIEIYIVIVAIAFCLAGYLGGDQADSKDDIRTVRTQWCSDKIAWYFEARARGSRNDGDRPVKQGGRPDAWHITQHDQNPCGTYLRETRRRPADIGSGKGTGSASHSLTHQGERREFTHQGDWL